MTPRRIAIIACGALAREIRALLAMNGMDHVTLTCLPATLHNRPERIPAAVQRAIARARQTHDEVIVAYGDCGTGGELDRMLDAEGVGRIEGPHCYSFLSGNDVFAARAEADMRCFFLTDFLARQFQSLVIRPLGLDKHPELLPLYFGHYERLVYLAQSADPALDAKAEAAAARLGLAYERREAGYGDLATFVAGLGPTPAERPPAIELFEDEAIWGDADGPRHVH